MDNMYNVYNIIYIILYTPVYRPYCFLYKQHVFIKYLFLFFYLQALNKNSRN